MKVIYELIVATFFASFGQVFWKLGMRDVGVIMEYKLSTIISIFMNPQVCIGLLFYAIGTIFWLVALSKKDLGYVYPFIAGTYLLVLILSYFFLGEHFGTYRVIGASVVLVGLLFIVKGG